MGGLVELSDAASVSRAARALFGRPLDTRPTVSQSGAVWNDPEAGLLTTLQIGEHAPKSDLDFMALHMARARADAIVITAKILRDEPQLQYDLCADPRWGQALVDWRERHWGLWKPPWLLILTRSGDIDFSHPVFGGWARPLVFTTDETAARRLADCPVPVVADADPDIRRAIQHLQQSRDSECISIEAGPSTSLQLHERPAIIDELLLSVYLGPTLDSRARGAPLIELAKLRRRFRTETSATHRCEGQHWSFHRFVR
ncbi:MAG: dihydrofolate reductase family protein [Myxococcota bacterium]